MRMVRLSMYCPNCGHHGIWQDEEDAGDYYAGTPMWCFACESEISDITVRDPKDPRQGDAGVRYSTEKYERAREGAGVPRRQP
jgi:hypothetical protein